MGDDKQTDDIASENSRLSDDLADDMDSYEATGNSIDKSIDKLENLIAENGLSSNNKPEDTSGQGTSADVEIPILTDVIDADEIRRMSETGGKPAGNEIETEQIDRLSELVETVDKKLSKELDSLVDLLKDTIKDSIIDELKEELKKSNDSSGVASKDKPTE